MIETITLITLSLLLVLYFRPGKIPPLNNPLVIERPGQYHVTLAPQLNLAQPFIEAIAKQIVTPVNTMQHSTTQCFEVHDVQVTAHGHKHYLLAVTLRSGMLHFQAIAPSPQEICHDSQFNTLIAFADMAMANVPVNGSHDAMLDKLIVSAVKNVAQQNQIEVKSLLDYIPQPAISLG